MRIVNNSQITNYVRIDNRRCINVSSRYNKSMIPFAQRTRHVYNTRYVSIIRLGTFSSTNSFHVIQHSFYHRGKTLITLIRLKSGGCNIAVEKHTQCKYATELKEFFTKMISRTSFGGYLKNERPFTVNEIRRQEVFTRLGIFSARYRCSEF